MKRGVQHLASLALALIVAAAAMADAANTPATPDNAAQDAADALFVRSDLAGARQLAAQVSQRHPAHLEALFVSMETAALTAATRDEMDAAIRLCETRANDDRVNIAAARLLDLAANTSEFRPLVPRIRKLIAGNTAQSQLLREALLAAAEDGLPGLSPSEVIRQSGILTDWRMAGPFGRFSNVDFERRWAPEDDAFAAQRYQNIAVERFRFEDGVVTLPHYFARNGVFYAESEVNLPAAGEWKIRVRTPGTLDLLVDGAGVLLHDARFRNLPATTTTRVKLSAGAHSVLVKFVAAASPFSIVVFPGVAQDAPAVSHLVAPEERTYWLASLKYWSGDYTGTIATPNTDHLSAALHFLRARAWAHLDGGSADEFTELNAALDAAPGAIAAEMKLAVRAYSEEQLDDALMHLRHVLAAQPNYPPAQELRSRMAIQLRWGAEAADAMEARLRLNPSCGTLRDAAAFFSASARFKRASEVEHALENCAPGSLAFAEALSDSGRHREAADAAAALVRARPLDRDARALLIRELMLTGDLAGARDQVDELHAIAPNWSRFRRMAEKAASGRAVLVEDDDSHPGFDSGETFYSAFRQDGLAIIRQTAKRRFSGGPAVVLLSDRLLRLRAGGTTDVYVHKLTRVLNRDGIERYGEVALPEGAELIELRTIKADGSVAEPEFSSHKASVSMSALNPGDVIEQEYVAHYLSGFAQRSDVTRFEFGSFAAPIIFARFAVVSPAERMIQVVASPDAPERQLSVRNGQQVSIWERNDIAQLVEEVSMPRTGQLPFVEVEAVAERKWADVCDYYRELMIEATRAGARVQQFAIASATAEASARALFEFVTQRIHDTSKTWDENITSAEDTLAARAGSRTATLLALARKAGFTADLLVAHEIGMPASDQPSIGAFVQPLVRLTMRDHNGHTFDQFLDAESEGIAFGALPAGLDRTGALLVPLDLSPGQSTFIALPQNAASELSTAEGDLTLDEDGNLSASVQIVFGSSRAAQMRATLREIPASSRQHFFEQLTLRMFPGASEVTGSVHDEKDRSQPLEVRFNCRSPRVLSFSGQWADMDQLVPALNLRRMYAGTGSRHFALYIDNPLFERSRFRVHLPRTVHVSQLATDLDISNQFGDYAVQFRQLSPQLLEITRSFRIPVQVVVPAQFAEFLRFASRIDEAERERLTLERVRTSAKR